MNVSTQVFGTINTDGPDRQGPVFGVHENKLTIVEPEAGHYLTQAADVPLEERIVSEKIYLAVNDSVENWKEITKAEADQIQKELEELYEAQNESK